MCGSEYAAQCMCIFFILNVHSGIAHCVDQCLFFPSLLSGSMALQVSFCAISIAAFPDTATAPLQWPSAAMILVAIFWPVVTTLIDELIKRHDAFRHAYYQRKLRLTFETKLGMYSPQ